MTHTPWHWILVCLVCFNCVCVHTATTPAGVLAGSANGPEVDVNSKIVQGDPVDEEMPPTVTEPHTKTSLYISQYDVNVHVNCIAEGNPQPVISWYRDGVKLTNQEQTMRLYPNGTLVLKKFYSDDNGYFQCKASNAFGTSLSQLIHIQLEETKGDNFNPGSMSEETFTLTEYEPFSLPCDNVPRTVPKLIKRWYGQKAVELRETKRVGVDLNGTLHFAYVTKDDERKYTCGLVPETSLGSRTSIYIYPKGEILVTPRESTEEVTTKPTIAFSDTDVKAVIGRKAVLQCFFYAKPEVTIEWMNSSNHQIKGNNPRFRVTDFGRKLVINPVLQQDEGQFTCVGTNHLGWKKSTISVNVTTPPRTIRGGVLLSQTVPDKGDITLKCKTAAATNELLDTPKWYKDGFPLNQRNVPARYKFSDDFTQLHIQHLDKQEDTSNFQCNSSNSEGYVFYDAYLKVIESIVITKRPETVNEIEHGDVIDITIAARGDYCCPINMLWHINGTIADIEKLPAVQKVEDRLILNTSLVSEADLMSMVGLYMCRVSNRHQSVPVTFKILPKVKKAETTVKPETTWPSVTRRPAAQEEPETAGIEVWWIGLIVGLLLVVIAVVVVIVIYKSNFPGSTYQLEKQEIKHNLNPEEDLLNQSFHEI